MYLCVSASTGSAFRDDCASTTPAATGVLALFSFFLSFIVRSLLSSRVATTVLVVVVLFFAVALALALALSCWENDISRSVCRVVVGTARQCSERRGRRKLLGEGVLRPRRLRGPRL